MGETVQSETRTGAASQPSGGEGQNTVSTEQEQPNATVSLSPWACAAPWAALGILLAVAAGLLIGERRQDWDYTENLWLIALVGGTMNGTRTWIVVWSILAQRPRWERVFYVLVGLGVLAAIRAFFPRYVSNSAANVAINAAMQLTCLALPLIYLRRRGRQVRLPGPGECRARNAHSSLFRFSIGELLVGTTTISMLLGLALSDWDGMKNLALCAVRAAAWVACAAIGLSWRRLWRVGLAGLAFVAGLCAYSIALQGLSIVSTLTVRLCSAGSASGDRPRPLGRVSAANLTPGVKQ